MPGRADEAGPIRVGILEQPHEAVPVAGDVEDRRDHRPWNISVDERHAEPRRAERDCQVDRRQRLPVGGTAARDEDRGRQSVAAGPGRRQDRAERPVRLPRIGRQRSKAERIRTNRPAREPWRDC